MRSEAQEEKAKTKRPKVNDEKLEQQLQSKYEQISFESEMSRIVKELVKNLPEAVQPVLIKNHLSMPLGLKVDAAIKPKLGSCWNKVLLFPNTTSQSSKKAIRSSPNVHMSAAHQQSRANLIGQNMSGSKTDRAPPVGRNKLRAVPAARQTERHP